MALILHIDTATFNANICIAQNGKSLSYKAEHQQKAIVFLHPAILQMMKLLDIYFSQLDAIMVHSGPGSYTGLRIGLATAKGICYAMQKPFITASSFDILSHIYFQQNHHQGNLLIVDNARADEWYFQYFESGNALHKACVKNTQEIIQFLKNKDCVVCSIHPVEDTIFDKNISIQAIDSQQMIDLGEYLFEQKKFTDIYYSEPFYCKDAYVK